LVTPAASAAGEPLQGSSFQGFRLNGLSIQATKTNDLRLVSSLLQGVKPDPGQQRSERGVDFSAVPPANVTVRLPRAR